MVTRPITQKFSRKAIQNAVTTRTLKRAVLGSIPGGGMYL